MIEEFKKFILRGNVVDLAVGVIVGASFSAIVTSLVDNILTPIIGLFLGGIDFSNLSITIGAAAIRYGAFIQSVIDFLIVAFCIFIFVKLVNKLMAIGKKKEKEKTAAPVKSNEELLLEEIRDLLKKEKKIKK